MVRQIGEDAKATEKGERKARNPPDKIRRRDRMGILSGKWSIREGNIAGGNGHDLKRQTSVPVGLESEFRPACSEQFTTNAQGSTKGMKVGRGTMDFKGYGRERGNELG